MIDQTLTIPQHADPIARGLLFVLLAAVLGLAVAMPAPATQASAPIVIFATPALRTLPMTARLDTAPSSLPTAPPTEPPAAQEGAAPAVAPTLQPPAPPATAAPEPPSATEQTNTLASSAAPEAAPAEAANEQPLVATGPQVPAGPQEVHQQPDSTYITVGGSPLRYYVDPDGHVTEVRLPGVDTAANGADIAAQVQATAAPSAAPAPLPASNGRGYLPRAGYRAKKP